MPVVATTVPRSIVPRARALGLALLVMGCTEATGGSDPVDGPATGGSGDASGSSDGSGDGVELGPDRSPPAERFDVPEVEPMGCRKIDFLFVIDDSDSMEDEQQLLIDGFGGFLRGIQETIEGFDFHVMVVGTGAQQMSFDPCENRLGTGRVRSPDGQDCGLLDDYLNGQRFIDSDHEDVEGAFDCIADLGADGSGDEKIVWALADAITEHVAPGQCNEGFLREDALLVVTIISDEEDDPDDGPPTGDNDVNSPGDPAFWTDGILQAKYGDEEAIVMLALLGDSDIDGGLCEPYQHPEGDGAEPAPRLRALVESFPYGSWASVCQPEYASFFNQAIADIDTACGNFQPPG